MQSVEIVPARAGRMAGLLALAALLAACAAGGGPVPDLAALEAPCRPLYADPQLDPVRRKLALDGLPAADALGDAGIPDAAEQAALAAFAARRADCVRQTLARLRATRPDLLPAYRAATARRTLTYAQLYGGAIGYGTALFELAETDRLYRQEAASAAR